MKALTPKQQLVMYALEQLGRGSVVQVAKATNMEQKAVFSHLKRLQKMKLIHLCEWSKSSSGHPLKIFQYGAGEDAVLDKKAHYDKARQASAAKRFIKRNTFDPEAPLAPNNGWVSTIHSWDRTVSQLDHIEYMKRFQPHPDHASVWLFNEPKSKLLGAKYD
jgi:hypothetical protein